MRGLKGGGRKGGWKKVVLVNLGMSVVPEDLRRIGNRLLSV